MLNQPFDADPPEPRRAPPRANPQRTRTRLAWLVAIPLVVAALALYWYRTHPAPPAAHAAPAEASAPADTAAQAAAAAAQDQQAAHQLNQAGEGADERLRRELAALSADPLWPSWLAATRDLVESCAVLIANVSEDDDPRRRLAPLRPTAGFETVEQGRRTVESPASMRRYDAASDVIASLDAHALAPLWRLLHPLISVAYHAVGRPGVSLDRAASSALKRLSFAAVPDQPPALQRVGKLWLFADVDVEKQGLIEKLLLRAGPANARKLQAKARELRLALALP